MMPAEQVDLLPPPRRHSNLEARGYADALLELLRPACERIEIAGSLRRGATTVGDLEIVARPRIEVLAEPAPQAALFGQAPPVRLVNCAWQAIQEAIDAGREIVPVKPGAPELERDPNWPAKRTAGSRYFRLYLPRVCCKVDLFLADVETWGAIFTIRTGAADFSRALVERWTEVSGGGHVREGRACLPSGTAVPTPEEEDFFFTCRAALIQPALRRGMLDIKKI